MRNHHVRVAVVHVLGVGTVALAAASYHGVWVLTPSQTQLAVAVLAAATGIGSAWILTNPPVHNRREEDDS